MKFFLPLIALFLSFSANAGGGRGYPELRTVNFVDLTQYAGKWYEVYRFPNNFERNCANVTAEYSLNKNGTVAVLNTCVNEKTGRSKATKATAFVKDPATNASLSVSFVPFFQRWGWFGGDYNVLALGEDYEWALVGSKNRNFLWFLSRTPELSEEAVQIMREEADSQDFDLNRLIKTPQI